MLQCFSRRSCVISQNKHSLSYCNMWRDTVTSHYVLLLMCFLPLIWRRPCPITSCCQVRIWLNQSNIFTEMGLWILYSKQNNAYAWMTYWHITFVSFILTLSHHISYIYTHMYVFVCVSFYPSRWAMEGQSIMSYHKCAYSVIYEQQCQALEDQIVNKANPVGPRVIVAHDGFVPVPWINHLGKVFKMDTP